MQTNQSIKEVQKTTITIKVGTVFTYEQEGRYGDWAAAWKGAGVLAWFSPPGWDLHQSSFHNSFSCTIRFFPLSVCIILHNENDLKNKM